MRLLCTDMDRTVIPNGEVPESPHVRRWLAQLIERSELQLAYVSGRDIGRVLDAIREWSLPQPDIIAGDVGTSIYRYDGNAWVLDLLWQQRIAARWNDQNRHAVADALRTFEALSPQSDDRQRPLKMSYTVTVDVDIDALLPAVHEALQKCSLDSALVYSLDPEAGVMLFDIVPAESTKRHAIEYLRDAAGLGSGDVLFCGDSGNDLDVLCSPVPSVLVANGDEATRQAAINGATASGTLESLYLARGDLSALALPPHVSELLNGNYSAGILEGMFHCWPDIAERFQDMVSEVPRYTSGTL